MEHLRNISGIILSGGQSSRMGREKGLVKLAGQPLVNYSINLLKDFCPEFLIGSNHEAYRIFGYPVIKDEINGIGPSGGILACLKASRTKDNIILSCDMPFVSKELIHWIIESRENADVVIPVHEGLPEPLCGFYSKRILPDLEKMVNSGIFKLQEILKNLRTKYLETGPRLNFYHPQLFENINSNTDLERIEIWMNKKR